MSGPVELTWDELDELADFTEGLLDGPAHERVAGLVRADERWALAYASLVAATPAVHAVLQAAGQVPASVPDDVVTRLDEALAAQAVPSRRRHRSFPAPARGRAAGPTGPSPTRPGSPRLRRRIAGAVTGALLLVGVVAFGAFALRGAVSAKTATDAAPAVAGEASDRGYAQQPEAAPTQAAAGGAGAGDAARVPLLVSGTDYRPETLHLLVDAPPASPTLTLSSGKAAVSSADALAPLATSDGLAACFAAVLRDHRGEVTLADYARFEGQPALVLVIASGQTSTVVAVGTTCGHGGADELAAVDVP